MLIKITLVHLNGKTVPVNLELPEKYLSQGGKLKVLQAAMKGQTDEDAKTTPLGNDRPAKK